MVGKQSPREISDAFEEATSLLADAAELLNHAERSLDAGDTEEVLELIQRRSIVLAAFEGPLAVVKAAAQKSSSAVGPAKAMLDHLAATAANTQVAEHRLSLSLVSERDRVGRELDQIESDEMVRAAYGKQVREQARINTVG